MSVSLSPLFNGFQSFLASGLPNNGGFIYTYSAGTTTPLATYTTVSGGVANSNPIILSADGRPPQEIWMTDGVSYKFVLTDSTGLQISSYDNLYGIVNGGAIAASTSASLVGYIASATGSTATTIDVFLNRITSLANGATAHSDGTNTLTGSPRWLIGNNAASTDDSALLIARGLTGSYFTGAHAIRDESTMTFTGSGLLAYASFDSIPVMSGTVTHNHLRGFQSRPQYAGSGTIGEIASFVATPNHTGSGTANGLYGLHVYDVLGTGPVTLQVGAFFESMTRGASNYALYSGSQALPSYHGGIWQTGSDILGGGKGTFTSQVLGKDIVATGTPTAFASSGGATLYYNGGGAAVLRGYSDSGGAGTGFLQFQNGNTICMYLSQSSFYPAADNTFTLGNPSNRFSTVYAGTGTINTSDARTKTPVRKLTDAEIASSIDLANEIGAFKFLDALKEKPTGARDHIGMTVQRAIEIMQAHGLVAESYGFICHDAWEAATREVISPDGEHKRTAIVPVMEKIDRVIQRIEVVDGVAVQRNVTETIEQQAYRDMAVMDENGKPVMRHHEARISEDGMVLQEAFDTPVLHRELLTEEVVTERHNIEIIPAGDRYGFRMDELLAFIAAGFNDRLAKLESK